MKKLNFFLIDSLLQIDHAIEIFNTNCQLIYNTSCVHDIE